MVKIYTYLFYLFIINPVFNILDSKYCILTLLLHSLLPPLRISRNHKPTITDSQDDFVIHLKSANDVQPTIEILVKSFAEENQRIQPRIIVVGDKIENLEHFYVFCDGIKYKCVTFMKCVDTIIKLCHVYKLEYSKKSKQVWIFLEQYFYNILTENFSNVSNLLSKL